MNQPTVHPFTGRNLSWLLSSRAERLGEKECLVWRPLEGERRAWSYVELAEAVAALAAGLAARGIGRGERVCVHMANRPEFLFAWFALARLGAVMVCTNPKSPPAELEDYLDRSDAVGVITEPAQVESVVRSSAENRLKTFLVTDLVEPAADPLVGSPAVERLSEAMLTGAEVGDPGRPEDPAAIQFTSGSSARPKGVVWSQANFLWAGKVSAAHETLVPDDRHHTFLPLFHTNAQSYSVMAALWVGATVVLQPRFSASRFWAVAVEERCTWCSTIPFAIRALCDQPVPDHSFRAWGTGVNARSWERDFGVSIVGWWGMTETVTHPIISEFDSPRRTGTMGSASSEYELRLVDDAGTVLSGPGEGLLEVRGHRGVSMALGYLDPAADAAAWDENGWFKTGDRVRLDEDGAFVFVEREKDMLKVGGENVAASEIEAVALRVPGVGEVAVVALPDPMLDEVPVAFVLPGTRGTDPAALGEAVILACRSALADFKVPRRVHVVDQLPRSTLEKVDKKTLRASANEMEEDYR